MSADLTAAALVMAELGAVIDDWPPDDLGATALRGSGIILAKDFSGVLSMNRDARAQLLSALREVYDGSWTRHVGSEGGRQLHWEGKAGMIGAVTPSIDRHHAVMGALGERFVLYRVHVDDAKAQARRRLGNRGRERDMRADLATAVASVLAVVDPDTPPRELTDDEAIRPRPR